MLSLKALVLSVVVNTNIWMLTCKSSWESQNKLHSVTISSAATLGQLSLHGTIWVFWCSSWYSRVVTASNRAETSVLHISRLFQNTLVSSICMKNTIWYHGTNWKSLVDECFPEYYKNEGTLGNLKVVPNNIYDVIVTNPPI